jgi:hypothetical protein
VRIKENFQYLAGILGENSEDWYLVRGSVLALGGSALLDVRMKNVLLMRLRVLAQSVVCFTRHGTAKGRHGRRKLGAQ